MFGLRRVLGLNSCARLRGGSGSTQRNTAALVQGTFKLIDWPDQQFFQIYSQRDSIYLSVCVGNRASLCQLQQSSKVLIIQPKPKDGVNHQKVNPGGWNNIITGFILRSGKWWHHPECDICYSCLTCSPIVLQNGSGDSLIWTAAGFPGIPWVWGGSIILNQYPKHSRGICPDVPSDHCLFCWVLWK